MSESKDYKTLRTKVFGPYDRIDRIENIIVVGMPDTNYCINGAEGWIEFKAPREPKRSSTRLFGSNHKLTIDQRNWILRQRNAGGKAWVLIVTDQRWMLVGGEHADQINEMTVSQLEAIAAWCATKPVRGREPWERLRRILSDG